MSRSSRFINVACYRMDGNGIATSRCCWTSQCASQCSPATVESVYIRKFCFQKTSPNPTTSYNNRRPTSSSFGPKKENHYCDSICFISFYHFRDKNTCYYGVKTLLQFWFLCKKYRCVCPLKNGKFWLTFIFGTPGRDLQVKYRAGTKALEYLSRYWQ